MKNWKTGKENMTDEEHQPKFTPEEIENSARIFKSATPKYTLDWYLKWISSVILLGGMSIRGIEGLALWDLVLSLAGMVGWVSVSILWKDRALIIVNGVGLLFITRNLVEYIT